VVKEANALSGAGYEVEVICTRTLAAVDERDADVVAAARWRAHRIDLTDRLEWLGRRLAQTLSGAFSPFTAPLTVQAMKVPADLYIAHYPAALPAAAAAARRHRARYAFDAEDFHPGDEPEGREGDRSRARLERLDRRWLGGCAYLTAAAPLIAAAYAERYGLPAPTVVLNTFPKANAPAHGPTAAGSAEPGPSIYWYSQTLGPNRGLEALIEAAARSATKPHLYLRGMDFLGFGERLRMQAGRLGVEDRLHLLAPAPPSRMEALAAQYDAGFVGETGWTANRRIALTNKQFTYLLAGLPSLMSATPGHADFAKGAEGAVSLFRVDDADDLTRAIDELFGDAGRLSAARAAAYRLGQTRFNWEIEEAKLLACVAKALDGTVGA
jgi:glycosyltransferase involved in cell wall biosynthesis